MDIKFFEHLLYEEETTSLDFKQAQYRFVKATDEEKSELLKDILGFVNAWRRSEAYILIGVQDVRGGRGIVVGIPASDHLDDHALQQFVNNLTNHPIRFHYEAVGFEGKHVGVIRIEEQPRPIYLKRDYGKLKKNEVYVRRGSSTDPTKPATPEEIAQMGNVSGPQAAELVVEFADVERDDSLGTHITWDAECCEMPPMESIPDFAGQRHAEAGIVFPSTDHWLNRANEGYFRQLANFEFARRLFRPVRLVVKNVGKVVANSVRSELTVPANIGVMAVDRSDLPESPNRFAELVAPVAFKNIRPAFLRSPGAVSIGTNDERIKVEIDCGVLQPGRKVWSEVFYLGKRESGDLSLSGQVFAENLPQPKDFSLLVSVNVTQTHMSVTELKALPKPLEADH